MIKEITIDNYKSISNLTLGLGKFNVFIGENGSGKTNILEAIGMFAAAKNDRLSIEDLANQGIRVAKPNLTFSSFLSKKEKNTIHFKALFEDSNIKKLIEEKSNISCELPNDLYGKWFDNESENLENLVNTTHKLVSAFKKIKERITT